MARQKQPTPVAIHPKDFSSLDEIDRAIKKLERRIQELGELDVRSAVLQHTGAADTVRSNIRETLREVFGPDSPEFREHEHIRIWAGPMVIGMDPEDAVEGTERGKVHVTGILNGLINRLREKREDLTTLGEPSPKTYFKQLNLHPRIADVANDLFLDGYHWEAVFAASKALVNYVKERSGQHHLDGAPLMRTVFSRNKPLLAFSSLKDQTEQDEQEGMMHLFEGAVLGIRNPGGHAFPEGSEQRAFEYISFLSLLAYRVQEAKRIRPELVNVSADG
jgi:uncharacterized protein (TIGR02391 family)